MLLNLTCFFCIKVVQFEILIFFFVFFFTIIGQKTPSTVDVKREEFICPTGFGNGNFADPVTCRRFYQVCYIMCLYYYILVLYMLLLITFLLAVYCIWWEKNNNVYFYFYLFFECIFVFFFFCIRCYTSYIPTYTKNHIRYNSIYIIYQLYIIKIIIYTTQHIHYTKYIMLFSE